MTADTDSTAGHAPTRLASGCDPANAATATTSSVPATTGPRVRSHERVHHAPPASSTTPPSGRTPVSRATT